MLEDGSWEKPQRPRNRKEYIPIEEVHAEHLHPGYDVGPRTPEEILLAEEHERLLNEHEEGVSRESLLQDEMQGPEFHERELKAAIARFEQGRTEITEPAIRKTKIKSEGSVRGPHGKRGTEPIDKHKKGGETIRKPNGRLEV